MKSLKENADGIVLCLFELIVGILLLINPVGFTAGIITIAGIVLMILGRIEVVKYFRMSADEAMLSQALTKGLLSLLPQIHCLSVYGSGTIGRPLCPWNADSEDSICSNDRHGNCFYSFASCCRRLHWSCGRCVYDHDGIAGQGSYLPDLPCCSSTVGRESHIPPCCRRFDGFACNLGACRSYHWRRCYGHCRSRNPEKMQSFNFTKHLR